MTFEQWLKRPVFVTQCRTWAKAAELGVCCHRFRCLPKYRDQAALVARKAVAVAMRIERLNVKLALLK